MGGFFGVVSKSDCVADVFYGTDYHSHLGTKRGGMAIRNARKLFRRIHDISNSQFRSKFEQDLPQMHGFKGIGVISDYEDQPLIIGSHLGTYAIVTVAKVANLNELVQQAHGKRTHFSEMSGEEINPTEVIAHLINQADNFEEGIRYAQEQICGSCSILILTDDGIYAARDRLGRTPIALGQKENAYAAGFETSAFPNLDYEFVRHLGPGEIVFIDENGFQQRRPPGNQMQICAFLWVYYGYPASQYEGVYVEDSRNRDGALLAEMDGKVEVDYVAGIPDSGTGHAIGYAARAGLPFRRPYVKYTPTWPRSFMPQDQRVRELVARMKLIPVRELIRGKRLLFCEDSIVRGTQLRDTIQRLYDLGAQEVHMRPACPPLMFGCQFLNFSRSRSEMDLAARRAVRRLEGDGSVDLRAYTDPDSERYAEMVDQIREQLRLTTLRYQTLENLVKAIGVPRKDLCTFCWTGECEGCPRVCGG